VSAPEAADFSAKSSLSAQDRTDVTDVAAGVVPKVAHVFLVMSVVKTSLSALNPTEEKGSRTAANSQSRSNILRVGIRAVGRLLRRRARALEIPDDHGLTYRLPGGRSWATIIKARDFAPS
jgi:hypothetical protein